MNALRVAGWLEAASNLALFALAMPLKYGAGITTATRVPGMLHGILFLIFVSLVRRTAREHHWPARQEMLGYLVAIIPFGTVWFDARYLRHRTAL